MTYKELLNVLEQLNEEQLAQTVTVYSKEQDEFCSVSRALFPETDVLDENHLVLESL